MTTPRLSTIVKTGYLADSATYAVNVTYEGEDPRRVHFTGDPIHGGPVVMSTPSIPRGTFVTDPTRFGTFGPEWIRRFFAN